MLRRILAIAAMASAIGATAVSAPPNASASSQSAKISKLQRDLKTLSKRLKVVMNVVGCMELVNLTQYGAADGSYGYAFGAAPADPASMFFTTGVDAAGAGDAFTAFFTVKSTCMNRSASGARAFGPQLPTGTLAHADR